MPTICCLNDPMHGRFNTRGHAAVMSAAMSESMSVVMSVVDSVELLNLLPQLSPSSVQPPRGRQHPQQLATVLHADDTPVGEHHYAAVRARADQAPETLLEPQRRVRQHVFGERVATRALDRLTVGRGQRLRRHLEGQL